MDKEIDNDQLKKLNPIPLRLSKQTMPNGTVYYRGNVKALKTVDIQEIARRIVEDRSEIRESTFIHTYGLIKEQIYEALARGENVDLGFGQLSIRVKGQFESVSDSFDPERNAFNIVFTPSARTRQLEQHLRAYKQTEPTRRHPVLTEVCTYDSMGHRDAAFNTVRSDNPYIHLIGFNIKVMGDHPDCKLCFRSARARRPGPQRAQPPPGRPPHPAHTRRMDRRAGDAVPVLLSPLQRASLHEPRLYRYRQ